MARLHGVSQRMGICILHDNRYYSYDLQCVQRLSLADFSPQERFCLWFVQQAITIMGLLSSVLFINETTFDRNNIINLHNSHLWATDNPHRMVEVSHQQRFDISVWAGIIGDQLLGPVLLPQCLNGEKYLAFLQNMLPSLLENVPLAIWQTMWLQHYGVPANFCVNVRRHLNNIFPRCWIGHGGPVAWPALLPDLNSRFLLVGASEKHCVQQACSWCSDPSTACPHNLWCYSDTAWNIRTSETIHYLMCALQPMEATSNICCDMDEIQAMYCVLGLFVWFCPAVPSTVETMHFWTQGDMNVYAPWNLPVDLKLTLCMNIHTCVFVWRNTSWHPLFLFCSLIVPQFYLLLKFLFTH